jgi:hypothetical protein
MNRWSSLSRVVTIGALLVAAAACSSGDDDDGSSSATTGPGTTEPAGPPAPTSAGGTVLPTPPALGAETGCTPGGAPDAQGVQSYTCETRNHVASLDALPRYAQSPPVGGDHFFAWQNCGVYDQPVLDAAAVHSLEHGAVWITYAPSLGSDQVALLDDLADGHSHVLVSPRVDLPAPIVASAWGKQMQARIASDSRLASFIGTFEKGPQTPEPGALCSGAIDVPASQVAEFLESLQ